MADDKRASRWAAILAGGSGTRFWPASRVARPKPFLEVVHDRALVRLTAERVAPACGPGQILYVIGEHLVGLLQEVMPEVSADRIIAEPIARNTLGAVLLAAGAAHGVDPDSRLAILPADHLIPQTDRFRRVLDFAFELADRHVVTIGIRPTHPETGFGYIRRSAQVVGSAPGGVVALAVEGFAEKPDAERARAFVESGDYDWNSGIFVFAVAAFIERLRALEPAWCAVVERTSALVRANSLTPEALSQMLEQLPCLSIDKAVMERCPDLAVIPADFVWSDVGTWDSLFDLRPEGQENYTKGQVRVLDGRGAVALCLDQCKTLVLSGVDDLVVVVTDDAVLVTRRGAGQQVGEIVRKLREEGREDIL